jgi:cytoskeletal protein CcmA (bactofilin family)
MIFNRNDKSGDTGLNQQPQSTPAQTAQQKPADGAAAKPAPLFQPVPAANPSSTTTTTGASMASVISKALKITGQLESTEDIQIDGQIEGDVRGVGVKIGQNAKVKGTVYADEVELAGTVEGKIEAKKVILTGTARMTGDVSHQDIKVESGAYINGSLKPELNKSDNKPVAKPAVATASTVSPVNTGVAAAHH